LLNPGRRSAVKELEQAAAELRQYIVENPDELDIHLAYEAVEILGIELEEGESRGDYTDCVEVEEYERLAIVLPEEEGDPTICIREGQVYVGPIAEVQKTINAAYAKKHKKTICACCGSFEEKRQGPADCEGCGNLVDASECLDSKTLDQQLKDALEGCEEIGDGDYEHVWVSKEKLPTHETPKNRSWLFVRIQYMHEYDSSCPYKFHGEIVAVNNGMAGKKTIKKMLDEFGDNEHFKNLDSRSIAQLLMEQGTCAILEQCSGNSKVTVLRELNQQLKECLMFGGFKLDRAQNAIGSSGWDFMKGDILAGIGRK
jgi:hypothetical protein